MPAKNIKNQISKFPHSPGVYIFRDSDGSILYVGKAKDLKKRASNYLKTQIEDVKTKTLVDLAVSVDFQTTKTELDAMILEAQLIETHQPPFNVTLKAGTPFLYLHFTSGKLPKLEIRRSRAKIGKTKGTLIGPFAESSQARALYEALLKIFKIRTCKRKIPSGCLYFHMGQCAGTCRDNFDVEAYKERLNLAKKLCKKGPSKFVKDAKEQIKHNVENLEFEKAQKLTKICDLLNKTLGSLLESDASKPINRAISMQEHIWISGNNASEPTILFTSKNGIVRKKRIFLENINQFSQNPVDLLLSFYRVFPSPQSIFVNFKIKDIALLQAFLKTWHKSETNVSVIDTTFKSPPETVALAIEMAKKEREKFQNSASYIKKLLKLPKNIHTIDCFDISHTQGKNIKGSCIRFTDGTPTPNKFRHFNVKTVKTGDDYASLQEIISRRYKGGKDLPTLVLIDGGKGQLSSALKVLPEGAQCAALAKREERIFSPTLPPTGKKLDLKTIEGALLTALRDYAHHFAISHHRKNSQM
ncbi:excinuclease ABC subunit UvrC [Candidatus Dependentiae bacterium]